MRSLFPHPPPSYLMIAFVGIALGFSTAVTVSVIVRWPGADKISLFAWGTTAGLILIGYLYRALWERRSARGRTRLDVLGVREASQALQKAGESIMRSAHRGYLEETFQCVAGEPVDVLPQRLHPAALGLLLCQLDFVERNPQSAAVVLAALRGGILGLVAAGQVYELEKPQSQEAVPS